MARHWLRGLLVGAIIGLLYGLVSVAIFTNFVSGENIDVIRGNFGVAVILLLPTYISFALYFLTGTSLANPTIVTYLISGLAGAIMFSVVGLLVGLFFKKKKR